MSALQMLMARPADERSGFMTHDSWGGGGAVLGRTSIVGSPCFCKAAVHFSGLRQRRNTDAGFPHNGCRDETRSTSTGAFSNAPVKIQGMPSGR